MARRIPNIPREEWTDEARGAFSFWGEPNSWENGSGSNLMMALANHPELSKAFNPWAKHLLIGSTVPPRLREIATLRMCWIMKIDYEWNFHIGMALGEGISMQEIRAVCEGPDAPIWQGQNQEHLILQAIDELLADSKISDATWMGLSAFFDRRQLMDFTFACGHYVMMAWVLKNFEVPFEDGVDPVGFDLKTASGNEPTAVERPTLSDPLDV